MNRPFHPRVALAVACLSSIVALYLGCSSSDSSSRSTDIDDPTADSSTDSTTLPDSVASESSSDTPDSTSPEGGSGDGSPDAADDVQDSAASDALADSLLLPEADADASSLAPACGEASAWQSPSLLAISTSDDDRFGSISADELSIAWTSGKGASATVHYAERKLVSDAFGPAKDIDPSVGLFAIDRVALSANGLRILLLKADRKGFVELVRVSRQEPFGTSPSSAFDLMNEAGSKLPSEQYFADPVFSFDESVLYYSIYGAGLTATLRASFRVFPSEPWSPALAPISFAAFDAQGEKHRHPTAISSDHRSLFFWDEVDSKQKLAIRPSFEEPFSKVVELGNRQFASPNQGCERIYYTAQGTSSLDLFVAQAK